MNLAEITRMFESATEMVADYRAKVAGAVTSSKGYTAKDLARYVNDLAEAEGSFVAIEAVKRALDYQERSGETVDWKSDLVDRLLNGADDSWSGRGNDVERAKFDGFRKQARRLIES